MSEPDPRRLLRARKHLEALEAENEAPHFACWRLEIESPEPYPAVDIDGPPGDAPPPTWSPRELNGARAPAAASVPQWIRASDPMDPLTTATGADLLRAWGWDHPDSG